MIFERELISLILYAAQQWGIVLAVGGQTIVLLAYLIAMRDRVVDDKEAQFARAVRTVLFAGLGLIILSGVGITALHYMAGEIGVLLSPAYLFKWLLVAVVGLFAFGIGKGLLPEWLGEGLAGGTWYALFFLHILAPVTTWENLLTLYGGWLAAFFLAWTALVFSTRERVASVTMTPAKPPPPPPKAPLPTPKPILKASPNPLVIPNIPSVKFQPSPAQKPEQKIPAPAEVTLTPPKPLAPLPGGIPPAPPVHIPMQPSSSSKPLAPAIPEAHPNLPAIRVMPKTPEELK